MIYRGLKEQSIPAEWLQELEKGRLSCVYQYVLRDNSIKKLSAALEKTVVPYILLKGAVLRGLYPEAWMRTSSDLDILVQEETLDQAVSAIESNTDFRFDKRNYHDVRMLSSQLCLELHFSIKEHMDNIDKLLSRVWEYASPQEGTCRRELSPEFQAFHGLAHMSYHMAHGGLGIRPYLDLWLLKRKTSFDDGVVRRMCQECGILRFYEVSCDLLKVWMEGAAHTEITSVLERYCLNGGVFGSDTNGAEQRKHRGFSYIFYRLFASREVLTEMYPKLERHPCLLPVYQIRRWLRLLDGKKRRAAFAEVKRMHSISQETIDSFDVLLNSLGM